MDDKAKEYTYAGFQVLADQALKVKQDPFYIPQPEEHALSDYYIQYVDSQDANGDVGDFFCCRWADCLFVCRSTDWPSDGGGCWCPACAKRCKPWEDSATRVKANKVRIYKVDDPRKAAVLPANIRDDQGGQCRHVPYNWPNTILQNLENRF